MTVQSQLQQASVRDFSGGLNLTDNPYNLSSKYQMVSDNVIVGPDGALSPRMGYKYFSALKTGISNSQAPMATTVVFYSSSPRVTFTVPGHGYTNNSVIRWGITQIIGGYTFSGYYSVKFVSSSVFEIYMAVNATAAQTLNNQQLVMLHQTTHILPGNILNAAFFQGQIIVFDDTGIIAGINADTGAVFRVWDAALASATVGAPPPWRGGAKHVSFTSYKQTLIAVDGRLNDKPVEINFFRPNSAAACQYLIDPATTSNSAVYAADFVQSFDSYVILYADYNHNTPSSNTVTTVDISAKNTSGVFVGNTAPDDAVQIDLGRVSQTVEPRITGVSYIRNKLFVAFSDSSMIGTVGKYNGTKHEPDFADQVPQHGALNHRVIHNVGNDLFMCDYAGIPAFSQSVQSGVIAPERLSQLIYSELNKHLSRLSQDTLRYKVWALYNVRDRMYMLFMPKFDSASVRTTSGDVIYVVEDFRLDSEVILRVPNHGVSAGDYVVIESTGLVIAGLPAADVNGTRRVSAVIDDNNILIKVGSVPTTDGAIGTCTTLTMSPVDDESVCYAYQFNQTLRIRRWTRFRGWYFVAGTLANDGRIFVFDKNSRVWQMGTVDRPLYADQMGYTTDDPDQPGSGIAIKWAAETPWSDMGDRTQMKLNEHVTFDVLGFGKFQYTVFVDNIYDDKVTYDAAPAAGVYVSTVPTVYGSDSNAFGAAAQTYGHGRRAREQMNYHFPFRCKLAKMRFQGESKELLRIVSVTLSFKKGSIYR